MAEVILDILDSRECEFVCVLIATWALATASAICLPEKRLEESEAQGD